jgi:hypothetical protein
MYLRMCDCESLSISQFCKAEHLSRATYYAFKRDGLAPREYRVPGTNIIRITAQARRDWQDRMENGPSLKDVERLIERGQRAGRASAEKRKMTTVE